MLVKDIYQSVAFSVIMGGCVYAIGLININLYLLFAVQVIAGVCIYAGLAIVTKNSNFKAIINLIKDKSKTD